jgi:hypothetical protein
LKSNSKEDQEEAEMMKGEDAAAENTEQQA